MLSLMASSVWILLVLCHVTVYGQPMTGQSGTVPEKPGACPRLRGIRRLGECVELCGSDFDCPGRQKCCSNRCGMICDDPVDGVPPQQMQPSALTGQQVTPDCSVVLCAQKFCTGQFIPEGQCCPYCPGEPIIPY